MTDPYRKNAPPAEEKKISLYIYTTHESEPASPYSRNYLYFVISEDELDQFLEATTSRNYAKKYFVFETYERRDYPPVKVAVNLEQVVYFKWS